MSHRRRVLLHIGTPKTGTTYLQNVLESNKGRLARAGIHYPAASLGQFEAALSLRGEDYQGWTSRWSPSAWDRLVRRVHSLDGTVVISHELFGDAEQAVADRAVEELSHDGELHLVLTARGLDRQVPAVWQENLKNRETLTYGEFLAQVLRGAGAGPAADAFWLRQDLPAVLRRWTRLVPRERVHVVTVPPPGSPAQALWSRFSGLLGAELDVRLPEGTANASLGAEQAELLRLVNDRLGDQLSWPAYSRRLHRYLMPLLTTPPVAGAALRTPDTAMSTIRAHAQRMVDELRSAGWPVIGDLDELLVGPDLTEAITPVPAPAPQLPVEDVVQRAVDALTGVLVTNPGGLAAMGRELQNIGRGITRRARALR